MFKTKYKKINEEINTVLNQISQGQVEKLVDEIIHANKIVTIGAGRVGMAARSFAMRLAHMGLAANHLGDATVPGLKKGDLVLTCSGSGETKTILELVKRAKKEGISIALVTGNKFSSMGKLAKTIVEIKAPSKTKAIEGFQSIQPMTTLNEQALSLFFDTLVLLLMDKLEETHDTMWERHSTLE